MNYPRAAELRAEARRIGQTMTPERIERVRAAVASQGSPELVPVIRFPLARAWAAAAALVILAGLVVLAIDQPEPSSIPLAAVPAPPEIGPWLEPAVRAPESLIDGEIAALGSDFTAVAQVMRGIMPF